MKFEQPTPPIVPWWHTPASPYETDRLRVALFEAELRLERLTFERGQAARIVLDMRAALPVPAAPLLCGMCGGITDAAGRTSSSSGPAPSWRTLR